MLHADAKTPCDIDSAESRVDIRVKTETICRLDLRSGARPMIRLIPRKKSSAGRKGSEQASSNRVERDNEKLVPPGREVPEMPTGPAVIKGLAPGIEDHKNSGFRAALKHIDPGSVRRVLEVGGYTGERTTVHLIDLFEAPIDIVEIDPDRAATLRAKLSDRGKFSGQVTVCNADIRSYVPEHKYDLIVLDLPTSLIRMEYLELLERLQPFANPGCRYILYTLYDLEAVYSAPNPPGGREAQESFMRGYFGTTLLEFDTLERVMRQKGFTALGLVDNWMCTGQRGYGHAVLMRN